MPESPPLVDRPSSAEAARRVIEAIRFERGHLDEADETELRRTSPEWREKFKRNAENHRNIYARFTKMVASQLYSSRFRCIPEILQNADDAKYSMATSPCLTFRLRPSELIIDSNEDGFTRTDVESICSTGESSKVDDRETTGEKGFGFKSIFGIARQVHIQSGFWSFRFEHNRKNDGLGMITPIWTEPDTESIPIGIGTRFRLKYAEEGDAFLRRIAAEFEKLPNTTLFALRNLRKLTIAFENVVGRNYEVSFEKKGHFGRSEIRLLTRVVGQSDLHQPAETKIRVFRAPISDLPSDDSRSSKTSNIVLGFQVDPRNGEPVIPDHGQQIFAFLPIERLPQLPFLIHADFVLAASREAIPETDWNMRLRDGVAESFSNAVTEFCAHNNDPLTYFWMRYLPTSPIEGFWEDLYSLIQENLEVKRVLMTRGGRLKRLSDIRVVPEIFMHEEAPIFPDTADDIYLAAEYEESDIEILMNLDVEELSEREMVNRLEHDICSNPTSHLRGRYQDESWHSSFATLAEHLMHHRSLWKKVRKFAIIPLNNGDWVTPQSLDNIPVYLPYLVHEDSVQIQIPDNLGLRKLHPRSCIESEASSFYAAIGISSCTINLIAGEILEFHKGPSIHGWLKDAVAHLEILFWYSEYSDSFLFPKGFGSELKLWAVDDKNRWRLTEALFFRSENPHHAEKLLENTSSEEFSRFGFLDDTYMKSTVQNSIRGTRTWKRFLELAGIRYYPKIEWPNLGTILSLVARDNPGKFIPNLQAHWIESYQIEAILARDKLKETSILCRNGQMMPLKKTLLPTKDLLTRSHRFDIQSALPFMKLPEDALANGEEEWKFLRDFDVICEPDLTFYLIALETLNRIDKSELLEAGPMGRIKTIYTAIYEGIAGVSKLGDDGKLKKVFLDASYIFIPRSPPQWCTLNQCVWKGPPVLRETYVLHSIYAANPDLERLFVNLLNVKDATFAHVNEDLNSLRRSHPESLPEEMVELMPQYYKILSEMLNTDTSVRNTRDQFEKDELIYAGGRWCKPSSSIWNSPIELSGRAPLEPSYPTLRNFFVGKLGVITMSTNVLAQELTTASKPSHKFPGPIKALVIALGQALSNVSKENVSKENLQALKATCFLHVREPDQCLFHSLRSEPDFFVNDHERYGNAFYNKIKLLDFTPAELTSLHPLFSLLDLQSRYLSKHVESETMVTSSAMNDELTDHLRQRAYALSCCASFYRSSKYFNKNTETHRLLLKVEVFVCDDMWTNLLVRTGDSVVEVKSDRALVKIEKKDDSFVISVPSDMEGLYSCYRTELPLELARILGIETDAAVKPIYRILNDEERSLDDIMKDEDIPSHSWFPKPPPSTRVHDLESITALNGNLQEEDDGNMVVTTVTTRFETSSRREIPAQDSPPSPPPPQHISYGGSTLQRVPQERAYRRLLQSVVRQARRLPEQAAAEAEFSLADIDQALDDMTTNSNLRQYLGLGYDGQASFEDNAKVGAAGELFVFERLKALGFPGFGLDNWQSRIRGFVSAHPEYAELRPWPAGEVADFMYADGSGQLESWLRRTSSSRHAFFFFPEPAAAHNGQIQYLIEVKTSTGPCETPFFMSGSQYKLMKKHSLGDDGGESTTTTTTTTTPRVVYVILRVYDLLSSRIGMVVYVDPWRLRDTVLEFVADPWKVVPVVAPERT